jgi:hypothetical protein
MAHNIQCGQALRQNKSGQTEENRFVHFCCPTWSFIGFFFNDVKLLTTMFGNYLVVYQLFDHSILPI